MNVVVDAVVVGAGVIGLAIARRLSNAGIQTVLLESNSFFGAGISSRSSEVIHAGLYYPQSSLKAKLCVIGNSLIYEYCQERNIEHKRIGKLVVAVTDDEIELLENYRLRAKANGVQGIEILDTKKVSDIEPSVNAIAALFSPSTGIVDSHALMFSLLSDFESVGGMFVRNSPVLEGIVGSGTTELHVGGCDPCSIESPVVINAAGLGAQTVARSLEGFPCDKIPPLHYAIGHYYALSGKAPFNHLIYPVAGGGGLGVHLTLDLAGQARFGPDISWRYSEDYTFDDSRRESFIESIQRYWPGLPAEKLTPGYTGIRPKLWGPDHPDQDFMIQGPADHGIPGLVNLFGIESPGLTASLAIADYVSELLFPNHCTLLK